MAHENFSVLICDGEIDTVTSVNSVLSQRIETLEMLGYKVLVNQFDNSGDVDSFIEFFGGW